MTAIVASVRGEIESVGKVFQREPYIGGNGNTSMTVRVARPTGGTAAHLYLLIFGSTTVPSIRTMMSKWLMNPMLRGPSLGGAVSPPSR